MQRLTYADNEFLLVEPDKRGAHVTRIPLDQLQVAARFRPYADPKAEKVLTRIMGKRYALPSLPPLPFLDPHQLAGVKWILTRSRSYLAHAPGAGKTAETVVAGLLAEGRGTCVFVVPPSLTVNWERETWKWTEWAGVFPSVSVVPRSEKRNAPSFTWNADFLIVPDSLLTREWVQEGLAKIDIKLLAVDEASRFKESTAERTLALFGGKTKKRKYPGLHWRARHAVLLDGSPMPNRPMELWAPTYAMAPQAIQFMTQQTFGFKYCGPRMNSFGQYEFMGSSNEEELGQRLRKNFMHVVTEDQLNHPERRRSLLFMNEDPRSTAQKEWERRNLSGIRLQDISEDASQGVLASFRRELGLRKVPWVARYVDERLTDKNEYVLLFCWHREVAIELSRRLHHIPHGVVMGGDSAEHREKIFTDFQEGRRGLIIGNIAAMGRGHNLQRADRVVFAEYSWTDELNKQCEKRASRKGSTKSFVRCEYIVAPNTLDEVVLNAVFTKEQNVKKVIG